MGYYKMENHTIGDDLTEAMSSLKNAINNDEYDGLSAHNRACLQEAYYFLSGIQNESS